MTKPTATDVETLVAPASESTRGLSRARPPVYCFDIDGTICTNTDGAYEKAEPFHDAIAAVNALYDSGHQIYLFTARGSSTGIDWREQTERQMQEWGVRYHRLFMGKPSADVYIDDKTINAHAWRRSGFTLTLSDARQGRI